MTKQQQLEKILEESRLRRDQSDTLHDQSETFLKLAVLEPERADEYLEASRIALKQSRRHREIAVEKIERALLDFNPPTSARH